VYTFEHLGPIVLRIDTLTYHVYYELHKGTNVYVILKFRLYFILKLVNQVALFHHGTAVRPPFKVKVFRCKLINS